MIDTSKNWRVAASILSATAIVVPLFNEAIRTETATTNFQDILPKLPPHITSMCNLTQEWQAQALCALERLNSGTR